MYWDKTLFLSHVNSIKRNPEVENTPGSAPIP